VEFLDLYGKEDEPFFLYIPFTAPHFPMQAWPEDIARYEGSYMIGWEELRRQRYTRMLEMGLVKETWGVSNRDEGCPEWEAAGEKERWDRKMAVYAAMVDRMDQGIGKVLAKIRELGKEQETLVMFLSDNGGCAEHIDNTPDRMPGAIDTYTTVDLPWANASNTPFRKFKCYDHEGGIATPLVVSWPGVIEGQGKINHGVCHVMDFLPTFAELAGVEPPSISRGSRILPPEGKSLVPMFHGQNREGHEALYWEHGDCRAVRKGKWKLVTLGQKETADDESWELYNMETDRCELNDLSGKHPEIASELRELWYSWSQRCKRESELN
jgi:arylsulfatase